MIAYIKNLFRCVGFIILACLFVSMTLLLAIFDGWSDNFNQYLSHLVIELVKIFRCRVRRGTKKISHSDA